MPGARLAKMNLTKRNVILAASKKCSDGLPIALVSLVVRVYERLAIRCDDWRS